MSKPPILYLDPRLHLELFKMMFDHHNVGVVVTDCEGVILYYNQAMGLIDDVDPNNALGRAIVDVYNISPDESPTMEVVKTKKAVVDSVKYYFTRSGKLVNARCNVYPLIDGDQFLGTLAFNVDYAVEISKLSFLLKKSAGRNRSPRAQKTLWSFESLVGQNSLFIDAVEIAKRASRSSSSVMIIGETGTGKELIAQAIHQASPRRGGQFTAINCAAIPENLLEGMLFGTVKGSFTGAADQEGLFEFSDGGTLFLDEMNSMPLGLQSKLLRAIQERSVRRIGGREEIPINVRFISSINRNPEQDVNAGALRPDLVYRLGVIKVQLPPLRKRLDDLPLLSDHFIKKHNRYLGSKALGVSPELYERFTQYHWPGNIRELEYTIEAGLHFVDKRSNLELSHLIKVDSIWADGYRRCSMAPPQKDKAAANASMPLNQARDSAEANIIIKALTSTAGQVAEAARLLGISPQLLHYKIKKNKIKTSDYKVKSLEL